MDIYINYPVPHFTIHNNPTCSQIKKQNKANQRVISINNNNAFARLLSEFINKNHTFSSTASGNDMWLELNLHSPQVNVGGVFVIQAILGTHYQPFLTAPVTFHC